RGTQLRGRSINHLIMVSGWWGKGAPSTIKSVYPLFLQKCELRFQKVLIAIFLLLQAKSRMMDSR
ncbi:hypothetical protein, partial [Escherichia coli]|uniref:hypothetical protein n=1 Tax=Escherichia coli TaxID=562 RepID=UPI0019D65D9E